MPVRASLTIAILSFALAAAGCGTQPPSPAALKQQFEAHRTEFVRLRDTITQDRHSRSYFTVGTDLIGDYWRDRNEWSMDGAADGPRDPSPRSLQEVLKRVGMSPARYAKYLRSLHAAGATRVTALAAHGEPDEVDFLIFASGIVPAGCSTEIYFRTNGPRDVPEWARWSQSTTLGKNWYALSTCN